MPTHRSSDLSRFASLLIATVRDPAIKACDRLASGKMRGPDGERWRRQASSGESRSALKTLIPDIVDQTIFELLNAIDNGELPLLWQSNSGTPEALESLGQGEMAGWYMGSPGWIHEHSKERFFDPHSSLELETDS